MADSSREPSADSGWQQDYKTRYASIAKEDPALALTHVRQEIRLTSGNQRIPVNQRAELVRVLQSIEQELAPTSK